MVCTDRYEKFGAAGQASKIKQVGVEIFADKYNHINGIENFWNQAKCHLRKFNGAPKEHFHFFLKECEWRFNNSDPKDQLVQLKQWLRIIMS